MSEQIVKRMCLDKQNRSGFSISLMVVICCISQMTLGLFSDNWGHDIPSEVKGLSKS